MEAKGKAFTSNHFNLLEGGCPNPAPQTMSSMQLQGFLQCKAHFHHAEVSNKVFYYIAVLLC